VIDFGISNVGSKADNDCVPTTFAEIESKRGGTRTYEDFVTSSGYKDGTGVTISGDGYRELIEDTFNDTERFSKSKYIKPFDPVYMQDAANNREIFSYHFKGHADNVRGLEVYLRAPTKNRLLFRQSKYNYRYGHNQSTILNIFRLF
jgi:hypothetical protein